MNQNPDIIANGPSWAQGCFECSFGIVAHRYPENLATLRLCRLVGFLDGMLDLCTCKAGQMYRISLLNYNRQLIEEARSHPAMSWCVGSHPEIESTRRLLQQA